MFPVDSTLHCVLKPYNAHCTLHNLYWIHMEYYKSTHKHINSMHTMFVGVKLHAVMSAIVMSASDVM